MSTTETPVRYYHGKTKNHHRFTLVSEGKPTKKGIKFLTAIALCANNDCFKKKFGREVATARLRKGEKVSKFTLPTHKDLHEIVSSKTSAELSTMFGLNKTPITLTT